MSLNEKRSATRHKINFTIDITTKNNDFLKNNKIINISHTGCLVQPIKKLDIQVGQVVLIKINESYLKRQFNFGLDISSAEVVRVEENAVDEVAIRFLSLTKKDDDVLTYLLANGFMIEGFPPAWNVHR